MLSKKLQEVLEDDFGVNIGDMDDNFNPDHPFFSVCWWEGGQIFSSHKDREDLIDIITDHSYRDRTDETYCFRIFDKEGNRLYPQFRKIEFDYKNPFEGE